MVHVAEFIKFKPPHSKPEGRSTNIYRIKYLDKPTYGQQIDENCINCIKHHWFLLYLIFKHQKRKKYLFLIQKSAPDLFKTARIWLYTVEANNYNPCDTSEFDIFK